MIEIFKERLEQEEKEDITKEPIKEELGDYVRISLGSDEIDMKKCLAEYNRLYSVYSDVLNWDVRRLATMSKENISISLWRRFLLDSRIQRWIRDEQYLKMQTKRNVLLDKVGDNNSTATVQALSAIMKATEDEEDKLEDNKIFIYSFIPLTGEEERLNNAQTLKAIPDEIRVAMQHVNTKPSNK